MEPQKFLKKARRKDGKTGSPRLPKDIKNFVIDIDGVICEDIPNEEPQRMVTAQEIPNARERINSWYDEGHGITFFTARTEDLRKITEEWLKKNNFKYHQIIFGKPRGGNYHYIDDRQIRATRFDDKFGKLVYKRKRIQVFE